MKPNSLLLSKIAKQRLSRLTQRSPFAHYAKNPAGFVQDVLGVRILTSEQVQILESIRDNRITNVQASHSVGKCVAQNDRILLSSGSEVSANSLVGRNFQALTLHNGRVSKVWAFAEWNSMEEIYEITTETGRRILRNANHPLWTGIHWSRNGSHPIIDSKGWTPVHTMQKWLTHPPEYQTSKFANKDWKVDQRRKHSLVCAVPSEIPIFGDKELPEHEIKLIAYLIGDGGLTGLTPIFTQKQGVQLEELRDCALKMGCVLIRKDEYSYAITNPIGCRHTNHGVLRFGLHEQGDFSCAHHISTAKIKDLMGHTDNILYGRLKMLGLKPVTFYGRGYISSEQFEKYKLFDECLKLSATEKIKGSAFGNQKRALEILALHSDGVEVAPVDIKLLSAQKDRAVQLVKKQQNVQVGVKRNGLKPNPVTTMLTRHGLMGLGSYHKVIPCAIFELPKIQLALFLSRLFATDGWACVTQPSGNRNQGKGEIGFCSVSQELIEQLQRLLLRFGIVANIFKKPKVNAWCLGIYSSEMLLKFAAEIGIYGKEEAVAAVLERATSAHSDKRSWKWRTKNAPDGTIWEKIVSIRKLDNPDLTVAIEVPEHHHYLTNFWEHNSFISACAVLWWVWGVEGWAISTAPTEAQCKEILCKEVRTIYDSNKAKLGGERGQLFVRLTENAKAIGLTGRDSNAFQGKHAERLLMIEDEACGISEDIDNGFESCLTGADNRGLRIGNPIVGGTPFEKACSKTHIRIPSWSHVNVSWAYEMHSDGIHRLKPEVASAITDINGEILPQSHWPDWCPRDRINGAVSIAWIEKVRGEKGESSAFWQSRVEGLFPTDSEASIIPRSYFLAARARYDADPAHWDKLAAAHSSRYGLDVGDGIDSHAIARWQGPVLYSCQEMATKGDREDVTRAAGMAISALREHPGSINVDSIGVGSGTLAILLEQGYEGNGINWGAAADDAAQFANCKAEQFWALREALRKEEVAIAPLGMQEEQVQEDLAGTYFEETSTGKVKIEDKSKVRKRLHRSTNCGDAAVLGFAQPSTGIWAVGNVQW